MLPTKEEIIEYYEANINLFAKERDGSKRLVFVKNTLQALIKPGMKVLDLFCGLGTITDFIYALGGHPIGVDFAPKVIKYAKENHGGDYVCQDVLGFELGEKVDFININDGPEHLLPSQMGELFKTIKKHCHEDTIILINTPQSEFLKYVHKHREDLTQITDNPVPIQGIITCGLKESLMTVDVKNYKVDFEWQYTQFILQPFPSKQKQDRLWASIRKDDPKIERTFVNTSPNIVSSTGRLKLMIIAEMDSFMPVLIKDWSKCYELKKFRGRTGQDLLAAMNWADVTWFEWCNQTLKAATSGQKVCKIVNRIHRYELFTEWPQQVDWLKVDDIIFVAEFTKKIFNDQILSPSKFAHQHVIFNPIDEEAYKIAPDKPKNKNVAWAAIIRHVKNPELFLRCVEKTISIDDEFRFFIAGRFGDPVIEGYLFYKLKELGLEKYVKFEGWVTDMNAWLADKSYIFNTSFIESQALNISEGAACGVRPLINSFEHAEELFPEESLFKNEEEFVKKLQEPLEPQTYREWAIDRFGKTKILPKLREIIES